MSKRTGIIHVYINSPQREGVHIVGDREGLQALWNGVGEAIFLKNGKGSAEVKTGRSVRYPIHFLRVDRKSHFLKQFPPNIKI